MLLNCGVGEDVESPLDFKEIQPVHSEGDQPWCHGYCEFLIYRLKKLTCEINKQKFQQNIVG